MLKVAAKRLRSLRKERGLSLRESADLLCISAAWLSRVERGHLDDITVDLAFKIRDVFGLPVEIWRGKRAA